MSTSSALSNHIQHTKGQRAQRRAEIPYTSKAHLIKLFYVVRDTTKSCQTWLPTCLRGSLNHCHMADYKVVLRNLAIRYISFEALQFHPKGLRYRCTVFTQNAKPQPQSTLGGLQSDNDTYLKLFFFFKKTGNTTGLCKIIIRNTLNNGILFFFNAKDLFLQHSVYNKCMEKTLSQGV